MATPKVEAKPGTRREARLLLVTWSVLVALTLGGYRLADPGAAPDVQTSTWLLAFATVKGHLIAGVFMEMRHGPWIWAAVMSLFLVAESALVASVLS